MPTNRRVQRAGIPDSAASVSRTSVRVGGLHAVASLLARDSTRVRRLWVRAGREDDRLAALLAMAESTGIPVERVARERLDSLAGLTSHQGVVAELAPAPPRGEAELEACLDALAKPPLLLILDGVQDPHNLGACLRTADAAGVDAVIVPKDRSAGLTAVVRKVASGAAEVVPLFQVTNLARCLRALRDRGIWLYGAAGEAEQSLYRTDLTGPLGLVLGSEGKGLRRLTREHCDALVRIPLFGSVASLNVSVAAGVLLFEARRQRSPDI